MHSCLSTPVENLEKLRKPQSSEILFCVTPVIFCKSLQRILNKIQLNPVIFSFLTKCPCRKQLSLSKFDQTIYTLAIFHHTIVKLRQRYIYCISL